MPKRRAARAALEGDELGNTAYIDLSKVQMFFCTLVAAVSYAVLLFSVIVTTKYPWDITAFPSLPGGLVAIRFISHAGYMTNKAVDQTKTRLSSRATTSARSSVMRECDEVWPMTSEMGCRRRLGHRRWRFGCGQAVLLILSLSSLTMLSYGCISWSAADGTQHALILGVGLVSTKHIPGHAAAAVRAHTVGLTVHTGRPLAGLALGYQSLQHTAIPSGWQGMVEVSSGLGQPLRIESCKPESVPVPLAISLTPAKEIE